MRVLLVAPVAPPYGGMALQGRQLEQRLRGDGIDVQLLPSNFPLPAPLAFLERVPGARTAVRGLLIWFKLWRRVSAADVVHVMAASWLYFFIVVYPAVLVGWLRGARVVVNYRGGEAARFFDRWGWLAAPAFRLAPAITAPSEFLAGIIRRRFAVPVSIVPNIVNCSTFVYRRRAAIRPTLLVTRHLERIYDIESILSVFRVVQQRYRDASLWIAGSGSDEARLRQLASSWQLANVRFLGEVPQQDLPVVYDQCDIYVNASLVDNFPGALLEASAAGLVVVTTGAGGIPAIYENGRTAAIVAPGDRAALAAAIVAVLEHPPAAIAMATAAVEIVRACEWPNVRERLFEAYGFAALADGVARLGGARCAAG